MKIIIFGAGYFGDGYAKYLIRNKKNICILGFIDNNCSYNNKFKRGIPIYTPSEGLKLNFDRIEVAIQSEEGRKAVYKQLLDYGVNESKIVVISHPYNDGVNWVWHLAYSRQEFFKDFVEFAAEQDISGNVAECGVFQGETAKVLNECFSNKKLYLFDTFSGFDERDIKIDRKFNNKDFEGSTFNEVGFLSNTNISLVMNKMINPENIIIKSGWIPDTFENVNDTFCLVNLDMDLYAPMLAGLRFFWNKMSRGGVILLHDYFVPDLPGVKKAVSEFESEIGKLSKLPLGDGCTLVVIKT
jgi:hypothetical protein